MSMRYKWASMRGAVLALSAIACGDGTGPADLAIPAAVTLTTVPPASAQNRVPLDPQPVVQLRDANGVAVAQAGTVVTVGITTGEGTLGGTMTAPTASTGAATFTDLSIAGTAGEKTLSFSATGLTAATATVTVTAGAATNMAINAGNDQSATVGAAVATAPSVKVADADANPVSGVAVTFAVISGGGSITGESPSTDASGIATVGSWTLSPTAGTNVLTATAVGLTGSPVSFTATGTDPLPPLSFASVSADYHHSCGITATGAAYCWGPNVAGELGDGTTTQRLTPVPVAGGGSFAAVATGVDHTCGLMAAGAAYCWGNNEVGQVGDGTTTQRETPARVTGDLSFPVLSAGFGSTCGVTTTGTAYCWGYNTNGQLGDGTTTSRLTPVPVAGSVSFAAISAGGMGGALAFLEGQHTCAVTAEGAAYCWGYNGYGRLGDGTTTNRLTPVPVAGGLSFTMVSAGANHTCGLTAEGAAYCWGDGYGGQIGDGTGSHRWRPARVAGGVTFISLSAGGIHTCGLTAEGAAHCWGSNNYGQLGDGTTTQRLTPVAVVGGVSFAGISAGGYHTCGVTASGVAYCWGHNADGRLGDGTTTDRYTPTRVVQ